MPVTQRPLNSHSKRILVLGVIGLVALATEAWSAYSCAQRDRISAALDR